MTAVVDRPASMPAVAGMPGTRSRLSRRVDGDIAGIAGIAVASPEESR
jgi:hypothetical protein